MPDSVIRADPPEPAEEPSHEQAYAVRDGRALARTGSEATAMQIDAAITQARDAMTVRRVFGDPIERDGLTVIPVANVMGGGGGGSGEGPGAEPGSSAEAMGSRPMASGSGMGFGLRATPAGVYVLKDGDVRWEPALDLTRVAIMGQIVGIVFLLVLRSILKSRR
jgi:uncharacterized spore protein YtfJ